MANNCDDAFQKLQELEQQNQRLREELEANERRLGAIGGLTGEQVAKRKVAFRTTGGRLLELSDAEVEAMHRQAAARMSSPEIRDLVLRSLGEGARPVGADGRFENYRRLLAQLGDLSEAEDWGKVTEMLYKTWEQFMPQDHAFVLRTFGQQEVDALTKLIRNQFPEGAEAAGAAVMRAIQENAIGFQGLAERKVRIRFMADLAKFNYLDGIRQMADALEAIPGAPAPADLVDDLFSTFKVALLAERQDKFANRMLGQALRSQQLDLGDMQLLQMSATEAAETLQLKPGDTEADSHFARVMEAINDRVDGAGRLRELAKATELDMSDPLKGLEGWENPHVRYAIALSKDSQLTSLRPQLISNIGGNSLMNLYGPVRTWMENTGYLAHNGSSWNRALLEGLQTTWNSHRVAMDMTRAAAKDLMSDAFYSGKVLYGGNEDFPDHGKTYNDRLIQKVQETFNQPLIPRGPNGEKLSQPQILARLIGKLQAGPRLLLFEKTGGKHPWLLTPGFRGLAAADNVFGFHAYVFGTRNDLELRARAGDVPVWERLKDKSQRDRLVVDDNGQLVDDPDWQASTLIPDGTDRGPIRPDELFDLNNPADRQAWIDRELADSFYSQAPTEQEVKAYRRANGLKGSDITDDEIRELISERNAGATYGAPNVSGPSAATGRRYSDWTRMQHEQEGALGHIDQAMINLRRHWAADALIPYWRAPFNSFLFDTTLGFPPLMRTMELYSKARKIEGGWEALPAREVAKVQAGWATSGLILSLFAGLDAAGLLIGNGPMDPNERREWLATLKGKQPNSIGGVPLGGLPVFNTLFLWKDLKDAAAAGMLSRFDRATFEAVPQILTSQLIRQTGFAQLKQLFDVLTDPQRNLSNFVGFVGTGLAQPFVGLERTMQLVTGSGSRGFYQPIRGRGDQEWRLPPDDPFEQLRTHLNNLAYKLEPGAWSAVAWLANMGADAAGMAPPIGDRRITEDFLGTPIRFPYGTPLSFLNDHPATPGLHPEGDKKLYGELDAQNLLRPPVQLLQRQLDGVAMSPALQKEYVGHFAHTKGEIPLSARMEMGGRSVTVSFPIYFDLQANIGGKGVHIRDGETARIELGPFLDKHVRGKTVQQALRSLINDPIYQRMQDSPYLTNDPRIRDMPPAERRRKAASVMIQGVYDYYHLLAVDRLWGSKTPAAVEWQEKRTGITESIRKDSLMGLQEASRAINGGSQ